jgi:rhamnogalacturonan acetylesterase
MPTNIPRILIYCAIALACFLSAAALFAQPKAEKNPAPAAAKAESAATASSAAKPTTPSAQVPRTGVLHPHYNPQLPTVFFIGDSTVKNGRDTGSDGLWGWANPVAAYFDQSKINVENQALGGTSSRSYLTAGHWDRVLKLIRPGDFVVMQFGHNDGGGANSARGSLHGNGDQTQAVTVAGSPETVHTYGWYLRRYIADIKAKGATPMVCSLIPRNIWAGGKVRRATGSYATWAAEAAKQAGAQFIDLNSIIADHYDQLGEAAVKPLFPHEHTHTSWHGAVLNAQCFIEGLKALPDCELKKYLSDSPNPVKPSTDPTDG